MIEVNQIIKNLIPTEPVTVIKVQALGNMYSIKYTGVTTNKTRGQCKKLRGKFINCYLCLQIHSLWS